MLDSGEEVTCFREKRGGRCVREREGARKRLIDFGKSSKTRPQFSDSEIWLTVSEVELVRQLARRI